MPRKNKTKKIKNSDALNGTDSNDHAIKSPRRYSLKLRKRFKAKNAKLTSAPSLFMQSARVLLRSWKLLGIILLAYLILTAFFVRGAVGSVGIDELQKNLGEITSGGYGRLVDGVALFGVLITSSAGASNEASSVYAGILLVVFSLIFIWTLRQIQADGNNLPTVRDAFYKSQYPLIPFLLVLAAIGIQLVPFFIGSTIYAIVSTQGIAVTAIEHALWLAVFGLLAAWSAYLLSSSLFALYIVTLADMKPLKALRSARELVKGSRMTVLAKLLFLPFILLVIAAIIFVPIIIFIAPLAEPLFFIYAAFCLLLGHSYNYSLYRELL